MPAQSLMEAFVNYGLYLAINATFAYMLFVVVKSSKIKG